MTKYEVILYYKKPLPQFFRNSMTAMLEEALEQGIIDGYEFNEYTGEDVKHDKKTAKEHTSGHDTGAREGTKVSDDKGKAGGTGTEHKEVRSDRTDSGKKKGG